LTCVCGCGFTVPLQNSEQHKSLMGHRVSDKDSRMIYPKKNCPCCDSEFGNEIDFHTHHILPRSLGGTNKKSNLIDICETCHGKIHTNPALVGLSQSIREGIKRAKEKGVKFGRARIRDDEAIWTLVDKGLSYRQVSLELGISPATIFQSIKERKHLAFTKAHLEPLKRIMEKLRSAV
jgi:hypothetical protein